MSDFSGLFPSGLTLAWGMPNVFELMIIMVVVLLLFGNRLPNAMKNLGQSFVAFKKGIKDGDDDAADGEKSSTKLP